MPERKQGRAYLQWLPNVIKDVAVPLLILIFTGCINFGGQFYQHHIAQPWLQCSQGWGEYFIHTSEVRQGAQLKLHPQLVVRYRSHILLAVYLDGYLDDEYVDLNSGEGTATAVDQAGTEELIRHIRDSVLDRIEVAHGEKARRQIESEMVMYISTIGGVTYVNEGGNTAQKFCIMGYDNIFLDYSPEDRVVTKRLNEKQLPLINGRADLSRDGNVEQIITALSDCIDQRFISKTEVYPADFWVGLKKTIWLPGVMIVVGLLVWFYVPKRSWLRKHVRHVKRRLRGWFGKLKWIERSAVLTVICACALLIGVAAKWVAPTEDEQLIYEKSDITEQTPVNVLFEPRQVEKRQELWPSDKTCGQLHVTEKFLKAPLGNLTLEYYDQEFERAYPKSGSGEPPKGSILPNWIDLTDAPYTALKKANEKSFASVEEEVEKCRKSSRPANLYQLKRALTDAVLENPGLEIGALFCIAGDAMAVGEEFLSYKDRQIGDRKEDIAGTEDIALLDVKIYFALGEQLDTQIASLQRSNSGNSSAWDKYTGYLDCIRTAGFRLAERGMIVTDESNSQYAKLAYYKGNLGEKLLGDRKEPAEAPYQRIGREARMSYDKAEELLRSGKNYNKEKDMLEHVQSGISTLEGKGFQAECVDTEYPVR